MDDMLKPCRDTFAALSETKRIQQLLYESVRSALNQHGRDYVMGHLAAINRVVCELDDRCEHCGERGTEEVRTGLFLCAGCAEGRVLEAADAAIDAARDER